MVYNTILTDITGLDNIEPGSITDLSIYYNFTLFECDAWSICQYLNSPNGTIEIHDNALGCNDTIQVQAACNGVSVKEIRSENNFTIIPNPLESTTLIEYTLQQNSLVTLKILDMSGREMATLVNEVQQRGSQKVIFETNDLQIGIYLCVLKTDLEIQTKKIIKLK
jgi:hypothetical protein